jgi:hypothetical protein
MNASYRIFRGTMTTWDALFDEAAYFASSVGPQRVISISHSEDANDGVVVVWYWQDIPRQRSVGDLSDIEREIEENQQ